MILTHLDFTTLTKKAPLSEYFVSQTTPSNEGEMKN